MREESSPMILAIEKWDDSFAIRLPKSFCETLGIGVGDDMRIIIEPARDERTLKERMRSWNGERYHGDELDWGDVAGEGLWRFTDTRPQIHGRMHRCTASRSWLMIRQRKTETDFHAGILWFACKYLRLHLALCASLKRIKK